MTSAYFESTCSSRSSIGGSVMPSGAATVPDTVRSVGLGSCSRSLQRIRGGRAGRYGPGGPAGTGEMVGPGSVAHRTHRPPSLLRARRRLLRAARGDGPGADRTRLQPHDADELVRRAVHVVVDDDVV